MFDKLTDETVLIIRNIENVHLRYKLNMLYFESNVSGDYFVFSIFLEILEKFHVYQPNPPEILLCGLRGFEGPRGSLLPLHKSRMYL